MIDAKVALTNSPALSLATHPKTSLTVRLPLELARALEARALLLGKEVSQLEKEALETGHIDFETRVFSEPSSQLFAELQADAAVWGTQKVEKAVVLERRLAVQVRCTANEYEQPTPLFAATLLARGLKLMAADA